MGRINGIRIIRTVLTGSSPFFRTRLANKFFTKKCNWAYYKPTPRTGSCVWKYRLRERDFGSPKKLSAKLSNYDSHSLPRRPLFVR
jgi:hypothetical protein